MSNNVKALVLGGGIIGQEYIKILLSLGITPDVVCNSISTKEKLECQFNGIYVFAGGYRAYLDSGKRYTHAIIALPVLDLCQATQKSIESGCENVLVEKPLTFLETETTTLDLLAQKHNARVYIAYNRRFYQSVRAAKRLIEEDGGVSSFHFDFSEAISRIPVEKFHPNVLNRWGIANSSHVIDTAFYLGGFPEKIQSFVSGKNAISWHPSGSIFTGLGTTSDDVPFTYNSNWACPGRWAISVMTANRKLILSPMETLQEQRKGSFAIVESEVDYSIDKQFKPGFFSQVMSFMSEEMNDHLFPISKLNGELSILNRMFRYQ